MESASGKREWCTGWCNENPDFELELDKEIEAKKLTIYLLTDVKNKIYCPNEISIAINQGEKMKVLNSKKTVDKSGSTKVEIDLPAKKIKSIRIILTNQPQNEDSWILIDEILVN
jgi:hypothetical protein